MNTYYVYILGSTGGTLYIGVTNDLERRLYEHKHKLVTGFTTKYNVNRLLYFEDYGEVYEAISREKELKGWLRKKKLALIRTMNPTFRDLSDDWELFSGEDPCQAGLDYTEDE